MHINRTAITYTLYTMGLLFVFYILYEAWPELSGTFAHASIPLIIVSTFSMLIHTLIGCWLLCALLTSAKVRINFIATCRIFYVSLLAKYLPGVVWGFAMQASMLDSHNAMKKIVFANIRLMLFISGFFFFTCLAVLTIGDSPLVALLLFSGAVMIVYIVRSVPFLSLLPRFLHGLVSRVTDEDSGAMDLSLLHTLGLCIGLFITYLLSISAIILAFYDFSFTEVLELAIYQSLSWVAGLLVFVDPAGMGVREAVFLLLGQITENHDTEKLQSIAIIIRTIQTFQDLFFSLAALILVRIGYLQPHDIQS